MHDKSVLIIVVTYNAIKWIDRCISSLVNSTIPVDVFVVDNGSTDGTQNYITSHYPQVLFVQSTVNLGFGKANNIGLQYALNNDYSYVYLLNQDAWIFSDTLEKLIKVSKSNPEYGILSPFQMEANMEHIDKNFKKNVLSWASCPEILDVLYFNSPKEIVPVRSVMAAHWLITYECLRKTGGFSPSFPHYAEDDNYQDRVKLWGYKIGIVPSLKVIHDREERKDSIQKLIYLKYTEHLRVLSIPGTNPSLIKRVFEMALLSFDYRRSLPCKYAFKLLCNYRKIVKNRKVSSIDECAFLTL